MADIYETCYYGGMIVTIALLVVTIVLFFVFKIPRVIGELTGRTVKKGIKNLKEKGIRSDAYVDGESKHYSQRTGAIRTRRADSQSGEIYKADNTSGLLAKSRAEKRKKSYSEDTNHTEFLGEAKITEAVTGDMSETAVLSRNDVKASANDFVSTDDGKGVRGTSLDEATSETAATEETVLLANKEVEAEEETVLLTNEVEAEEATEVLTDEEAEEATEEATEVLTDEEAKEATEVLTNEEAEEATEVLANEEAEEATEVLANEEVEEATEVLANEEVEEATDVLTYEEAEATEVLTADDEGETEVLTADDEGETEVLTADDEGETEVLTSDGGKPESVGETSVLSSDTIAITNKKYIVLYNVLVTHTSESL